MNGFYVVGTSYGVGCTTASVGLIVALRGRGMEVSAFKPVEVGCNISTSGGVIDGIPGGELSEEARRAYERLNELVGPPSLGLSARTTSEALRSADAARLAAALDGRVDVEVINRARYAPRVAPALAARLGQAPLRLETLEAEAKEARGKPSALLVVDGCGGVLEPYGDALVQRDLMRALGLPAVLVGTTKRAAINEVLLSVEALKHGGVVVAGVVLVRHEKRPRPEEAAVPLLLDEVHGDLVRGVLPYFDEAQLAKADLLGERYAVHVDVDALLGATSI